MIAAVILAAGASTRLGKPKQLIVLAGETLLERAVRTARDAGCTPIIVVLGAHSSRIREHSDLGDAAVVINAAWEQGMASSIRAGASALSTTSGVVLITCDQPAVTADHLRALIATGEVTASAYADRKGVPAYFPAASFPALMNLQGDTGARDLLRTAPAIDLAGGDLDIDTMADLDETERRFR